MYISTYSLTSVLDGGKWSASRHGRFTLRERAPGSRLGGPQNRSGHGCEGKHSQPPPGSEHYNPDCPARSLVAIPTELSRLYGEIITIFNNNYLNSPQPLSTLPGSIQ
jgi:hypothetical protein